MKKKSGYFQRILENKDFILTFVTTWMKPEDITLSEKVIQTKANIV